MLQVLKSTHPLTEFTPTWEIPFWHCQYDNAEGIRFIRNYIIDHEETIKRITDDPKNDGGTGLGLDSLTARYLNYNLFKITRELPHFQKLYAFIQSEYKKFMNEYQAITRDCYFFSWANVVRQGQTIDKHGHGALNFSYLSGNMHLDNYKTETIYYCPQDDEVTVKMPNIEGGLTFFPSYVLHEVPAHTEDNKRVSLAFDLYDKQHYTKLDETALDFNVNR